MYAQGGFKMNFEVDILLKKLRTNLDEHKVIYEEAKKGYLESLHTMLEQMLIKVADKNLIDPTIDLQKPANYSKAYQKAIQMLEFTSDKTITLDQSLFDRYVLDEWDWSRNFLSNSVLYGSATASSKVLG